MNAFQISLLALWMIEQDWTITTGTGTYGLQGAEGATLIWWGSSLTHIPVHLYVVTAMLAFGLALLIASASLAAIRVAGALWLRVQS